MRKLLAEALVGAELRFGLVSKAIETKQALEQSVDQLKEKAAIALVGEENTFNKDKYIVVPKELTASQLQELAITIGTTNKVIRAVYNEITNQVGQSFE